MFIVMFHLKLFYQFAGFVSLFVYMYGFIIAVAVNSDQKKILKKEKIFFFRKQFVLFMLG